MNAKQITEKNIIAQGYRIGKSVQGKGVELFGSETHFATSWSLNVYPEKRAELLKKFENANFEELYVSKIRYVSKQSFEYPSIVIGQKRVNLKKLIKSKFEGLEHVYVRRVPSKLLGHFPISKYKADLESQKEMMLRLLNWDGIQVLNNEMEQCEYDIDDSDTMEFSQSDSEGNYYNGDYALVHGTETFFPDTNACEYMDGKPRYHNSHVVEAFWNFDYEECMKPYLVELDPEEKMCVYHRKGKDWYVGAQYELLDIPIIYRDEDEYATHGEVEEETFYAFTYKDDAELTEKFVEILESFRDGIAMNSYINNELETGESSGYGNNYYNDSIVNKELVELLYEDKGDLKEEINDLISNWELNTLPTEFLKAYTKAIDGKVKVQDDFKVELTFTPIQMLTDVKPDTTTKYNHLKILKVMEKRFGYELVNSVVSNDINITAWALKIENEEYHFDIAGVIANDIEEKETLREFIVNALEALQKRKIEKLSQAELFEKASHVFIGIADSLKSGNCSFGTDQFIFKHHIDTKSIGGIRGDVLLEMENSSYTKRAVSHAIAFHGGVAC